MSDNKNDDFIIHNEVNSNEESAVSIDANISNTSESAIDNIEEEAFKNPEERLDEEALMEEIEETSEEPHKKHFLINEKKHKKKKNDIQDSSRRSSNSISSARNVVIDFLEGTTKKNEAMDYARGFIDNHYASPKSCFIYTSSYEDVYAVEIHDGGEGKPYLPNVIKTLEDDPTACACIQNKRRTLEIKKNDRGEFSSILLPEGLDSTETNIVRIYPDEKSNMRPYSYNNILFAIISMTLCALGFTLLVFTTIVALLAYQKPIKTLPTTKVKNLPIQQWGALIENYTYDMYVEKVTFEHGRWKTTQRKAPIETEKVKEELKDIVKEEVKNEIEKGSFLTNAEKEEIAKHLKENIIHDVQEKRDQTIDKVTEEAEAKINEEIMQREFETSNKEIYPEQMPKEFFTPEPSIYEPEMENMPPMDEFEFGEMGLYPEPRYEFQEEMMHEYEAPEPRKRPLRDRINRERDMPEGLTDRGEPDVEDMGSIVVE